MWMDIVQASVFNDKAQFCWTFCSVGRQKTQDFVHNEHPLKILSDYTHFTNLYDKIRLGRPLLVKLRMKCVQNFPPN